MGLLEESFELFTDNSLLQFIPHLFKCPENVCHKLWICFNIVLYIDDTVLPFIL